MNNSLLSFLKRKAYNLRVNSLLMTTQAGSGHATSCLSAADLVAALFFYGMQFDPRNNNNSNNDRFILSKGHASPLLYAVWKELGELTQPELMTYRHLDSRLEGHPTPRFEYAEAATGSLGIGLSIGAGMALAAHMQKRTAHTFVLLGDAEIAEGSVWEAAEIASFYNLNNLVAVLDDNRLGQSTQSLHGHNTQRYADKFAAFGWNTLIVDGHDMTALCTALDQARASTEKPFIIIAKTYKGYGIDHVENKEGWHGKPIPKEELPTVLEQLKKRFFEDASFDDGSYHWQPTMPRSSVVSLSCDLAAATPVQYAYGTSFATRKAYGEALAQLGKNCQSLVVLDAEVKNSTFAEIFEKAYPDRFIQCFVAEQNMISMGVGLQRAGYVPFISTFGAFFSRAFDQIRMAAIGSAPLRLCGSHAGVSIGEDGPSQMALEDIALMRALPNSLVLYPSDAVATQKLVHCMARYNEGISYLRTTRAATPVVYAPETEFIIGGSHVLKQSDQDVACVVAAGITLFEALKAYEQLRKDGISIAVVDLYSIKPIDAATLWRLGIGSNNTIITVEDHYAEGGIGEAVMVALQNSGITVHSLAVTQIPRSGKPEELLALMQIDAAAICRLVREKC